MHHRYRLAHGEMQALDGRRGIAFQDDAATHGLHAQRADVQIRNSGQDKIRETSKMRIHHVDRHLHGVKPEVMSG
jgi:hypothetical protein